MVASAVGDEAELEPDRAPLAKLLGLNDGLLDVYRIVVRRPGWGIAEIAWHLGMAEAQVRGCLDKLAELSMLYPAKHSTTPIALNPEIGLAALLNRRESEIQNQQAQLAAARTEVAELAVVYSAHQGYWGNQGLEQLDEVATVRARLAELAEHAQHELLSFIPGGAQSREALDASRPLDEKSLSAGVRIRTLYLDSVRNDRATTEYARRLAGLGGEIRTIPSLPVRMLVVDRSVALLPIDPENSRAGAVMVKAPGVLAALVHLFEVAWQQGQPLDGVQPSGPGGLTAQELELLKLLEMGSTDEMAARKLGVSLRTVRRMMADIMGRLGARSRFEAGLLATRAGWM
ncbi:LuxR C-terminal-related transcriptional regulator [Streptomyces sp. ISL-100]|uniref:LuxR C-terminal-related transcriptional regulator n=1 Tax=Streptomyces sp. ISL-100 TaxID=2819173 RepID=UPI001BE530C9|nr:LuxR C-terminal-related transcriptional regulator [Streptomyces sp. ISL-100]MBT2399349.1 helix-turn-helix transcriptional regulator [Streptomyces sp. ISL-100]